MSARFDSVLSDKIMRIGGEYLSIFEFSKEKILVVYNVITLSLYCMELLITYLQNFTIYSYHFRTI